MVQCDRNLFPFGVSSWSTLLYHVCLFHYHGNVITSTLSVVRVHLCNDCKRSTPHSIVRWRLVQFPGCFSVNWELFLSACVLRRFAVDCPRVFLRRFLEYSRAYLRRFFPGLLSCVLRRCVWSVGSCLVSLTNSFCEWFFSTVVVYGEDWWSCHWTLCTVIVSLLMVISGTNFHSRTLMMNLLIFNCFLDTLMNECWSHVILRPSRHTFQIL